LSAGFQDGGLSLFYEKRFVIIVLRKGTDLVRFLEFRSNYFSKVLISSINSSKEDES